MSNNDKIGLLYSTATGIVLRTINPSHEEQHHLAWLSRNVPEGTTLLFLNKDAIGADEENCPNLDMLIPHVQKNHNITLSFGVHCSVVDTNNTVVSVALCCPVLYKDKLAKDPMTASHTLVQKHADVGDIYDHSNAKFTHTKGGGKTT